MNDTWAAVLALSVAIMALVQLTILVVLGIAAKRILSVVEKTQDRVESLAADVKVHVASVMETVNGVTMRVNAVADDVKGVTTRVQHVAQTLADGVQRMEHTVRSAGQKVVETVEQVPAPVKKGVPAGLAILAALRTVQQVRQRMRAERARRAYSDDDMYASMHG